jgi:transketolase
MRKQFVTTVEDLILKDEKVVLLLGDIGVFGFRNSLKAYPDRVFNIGILEQSMTSLAAGLSKEGFYPILHSIAPFIVERCFEQLKVDIGYQKFSINIVSVGASYDYAALGCTHHCPGDVSLMLTIPDMNVLVPGTENEFDSLFRYTYKIGKSNYFRLTEKGHSVEGINVEYGKGVKVKSGINGTVIAIGPMLGKVLEACRDLDVTVLYYTTLFPFDGHLLKQNFLNGKLAIVEPFYEGTTAHIVLKELEALPISIKSLGVPREFLTRYGSATEHDEYLQLDTKNIFKRLNTFFNA